METKQFFFPDSACRGGSGLEGALIGSMMNGGMGGNGMWNNPWWALIFLAAFRGNGLFGNDGNGTTQLSDIQEQLNTIQGQNCLMSAIQGGANEVRELANTLNCDINAVQTAISAVQSAICNLGNSVNLSSQSIINAVNSGDRDIINQLSSCCCDLKQLVTTQGYQNQLANCEQTNTITGAINNVAIGQERGFSQVAYAAADQTCQIKGAIADNTRAVLGKLDALERQRLDEKIEALTAQNAVLTSRAERQAELQPIYSALADLKCNQPEVKKISCPDQYVRVDSGINAHYGLVPNTFGCGGYGYGFGYPYGFVNGFNNAF